MKLTAADKEYLKEVGYLDEDMQQIEEATGKTTYETESGKRLSTEKVIELIGRENYLSGVARSAFHWSATREVGDSGWFIYFDSSRLFRSGSKKQPLDSQINDAEVKSRSKEFGDNFSTKEPSI